jgi:hypothetical protein
MSQPTKIVLGTVVTAIVVALVVMVALGFA